MQIVDISEVLLEAGLSASATEEERAITQSAITKSTGAIIRHLKYDPVQRTRTEFLPNTDFTLQGRASIWEVSDTEAFTRRLSESAVDELQVKHLPIRSITTLHIDFDGRSGTRAGSFGSDTLKTEGVDFFPNYDSFDSSENSVCRDGIIRSQGRWPSVPGSVKVVYVAGYSEAELHGQDAIIDASPIMDAVIDESVRRILKAFSRMKKALVGFTGGAFSSETLGDYSYTLDGASVSKLVGGGFDILSETAEKLQEFVNYGVSLAS